MHKIESIIRTWLTSWRYWRSQKTNNGPSKPWIFKEWFQPQTLWFWNFSLPTTCWGHSSHWNTLVSCFLNWCLFQDFFLTISPQSSQTLFWVFSSASASMLKTKSHSKWITEMCFRMLIKHVGTMRIHQYIIRTVSNPVSLFHLLYNVAMTTFFKQKVPPSSCWPAPEFFMESCVSWMSVLSGSWQPVEIGQQVRFLWYFPL